MKLVKKLLMGVCVAALMAGMAGSVMVMAAPSGSVTVTSDGNKAPTFTTEGAQEWTLIVHNNSNAPLSNAVIAPRLGDTNDEWPFKTEYQNYAQRIEEIPAGESVPVTFVFEQREDVATSRHTLQFDVYTEDSAEPAASQKFYVNTTAKPADNPGDQMIDLDQITGGDLSLGDISGDMMSADAGGFSNGDVSGGGGSADSESVPRVIVTGFNTDPAEVRAGSNFNLIIHLKNTSKTTKVSNMLFDLSAPTEGSDAQTVAPAFLPMSGSSSIYLEGIKANGTADISIQLNAKADLLQKPYSVDLSMKYEGANGTPVDASSSLSIPVKQDARFEFSDFEISPDTISVGDEANVMCNLYNMGRIKLYNVKATFEGACIEKEEVFVGNVESGATASIDAMLEGTQATGGPASVKMTLSYEDESGKISVAEKELQLEVMEAMESGDMMPMDMEMMEEPKQFPVVPVAVAAGVVVLIIIIVVISKRRKRRKRLNEEEELLDELDRPSEDER